jgi:hypothetical protein
MPESTGSIYLIAYFPGRLVKIGWTDREPTVRFRHLQSQCPVPLFRVGHFPGTRLDEGRLHERFRKRRVHGEWFTAGGELKGFLAKRQTDWWADNPTDYELSIMGFVPRATNTTQSAP